MHRNKHFILWLALVWTMVAIPLTSVAQRSSRQLSTKPISESQQTAQPDSLVLRWQQHADSLQALVDSYRRADSLAQQHTPVLRANPYYFPLLSKGTLYQSPLRQMMTIDWIPQLNAQPDKIGGTDDSQLDNLSAINQQLAAMYVKNPSLFQQTQEELMREGQIRQDVKSPITNDRKIVDRIELADIHHDVTDNISAITRRPNFWKFRGNSSLTFTQSYFSDNWFQGGDKNYSFLSMITAEANYDNKQRVQWENKVELQLGFQTTKNDDLHKLKATSNLTRVTSKFGFKAAKTWYYTAQIQAYTQIYPNYKSNSDEVTADFCAPLYGSLSVGMDYKLNKKRFRGSLYLSPFSTNARYVRLKELRSRYNDNADQVTKWTFGPNITVNFTWDVVKNVQWVSRLYWFSDFHYTNIEWENTYSFQVNKYLTCKLFVYPKFLDNKPNYKNEHGNYFMLREWLSLGVSYAW